MIFTILVFNWRRCRESDLRILGEPGSTAIESYTIAVNNSPNSRGTVLGKGPFRKRIVSLPFSKLSRLWYVRAKMLALCAAATAPVQRMNGNRIRNPRVWHDQNAPNRACLRTASGFETRQAPPRHLLREYLFL